MPKQIINHKMIKKENPKQSSTKFSIDTETKSMMMMLVILGVFLILSQLIDKML